MGDRGGKDTARLYIADLKFRMGGTIVNVKATELEDRETVIERHKDRYRAILPFLHKGMKVLDFPCGSGYAYPIFKQKKVIYQGMDYDQETLWYAMKVFYNSQKVFTIRDMREPYLPADTYDVAVCIEGIEHIERKYHAPLIRAFHSSLKNKGKLIISTPEAPNGSGPSKDNKYHLCELTRADLKGLLKRYFRSVEVEVEEVVLHNKKTANQLMAVCIKEG